jgi:hypothetical protein
MNAKFEGAIMTVPVVYKCEQTPGSRFRAKGEIIIFAEGKYVIQEFRDPVDSLTFDTTADAEGRTWQLALSWRDTEMPSADLIDDKGRCSRGTA